MNPRILSLVITLSLVYTLSRLKRRSTQFIAVYHSVNGFRRLSAHVRLTPKSRAIPWKGGRYFHMRNYELTFIVPSDVNEEELNGVVTQIQGWVEGTQGKVNKVDHWGRRRLAYNIAEYREGYYVA